MYEVRFESMYEVRFSIDDLRAKTYEQLRFKNQQSPIKNQQSYLVNRTSYSPQPIFKFFLKIPTSLSPRPETFTITISDFFIVGARLVSSATTWTDSSAGRRPSVRCKSVQPS